MNRGIYATATGMIAADKWMSVVSNNLANVSTNGFKRDELVFADAYQRELRANGGRGMHLGSLGSGAMLQAEYTVFERGAIVPTGNPLDLAIDSERGLFAVETPQGVRYTRDGAFQLDSERRIVTKSGHPVLDDRGNAIELPLGPFRIEPNGAVIAGEFEIARIGVYEGRAKK